MVQAGPSQLLFSTGPELECATKMKLELLIDYDQHMFIEKEMPMASLHDDLMVHVGQQPLPEGP